MPRRQVPFSQRRTTKRGQRKQAMRKGRPSFRNRRTNYSEGHFSVQFVDSRAFGEGIKAVIQYEYVGFNPAAKGRKGHHHQSFFGDPSRGRGRELAEMIKRLRQGLEKFGFDLTKDLQVVKLSDKSPISLKDKDMLSREFQILGAYGPKGVKK